MKTIALILALLTLPAVAQNVRYDIPFASTTGGSGQQLPVYALPYTGVSFFSCTAGNCSTPANTYNSVSSTSPCPTGSNVVLQGSASCTNQADAQGNAGAWFLPGQYAYTLRTQSGATYGPFNFSVGGGGSGSSGVSSLNTLTGALSILCGTGLTCTTAGSSITISTTAAFAINSFTGCNGSLELGASVTNPTCSALYTATPASATITNTDNVDSPLALTTPFTSGTIVGTFTHSAIHTTTVTLTAVGSSTQTANQTYTWNPRIFGGVGAAGATSTVTATGTSALLSTSNVIASAGLGVEQVGQIIGSYTTSSQVIYLLLTGSTHTMVDNNTGFPMAFNAPTTVTFVNVNGVTVTMYLYQTTNLLFGMYSPRIAS